MENIPVINTVITLPHVIVENIPLHVNAGSGFQMVLDKGFSEFSVLTVYYANWLTTIHFT